MGSETPPAGLPPDGNPNAESPRYLTHDALRDLWAGMSGKLLQQIDQRLEPVNRVAQVLDQYAQVVPPEPDPQAGATGLDDWVPRSELQAMEARIRADVQSYVGPVQASAQKMQAERVWERFASQYPDLASRGALCDSLANRVDPQSISHLTEEQRFELLAKLTRAEIASIRGGAPAAAPPVPQVTPGVGISQPGVQINYDTPNPLDAPLDDKADIDAEMQAQAKRQAALAAMAGNLSI